MRLVVFSADHDALQLIRATLATGRHALVGSCESQRFLGEISQVAPMAKVEAAWESLLHGGDYDAVVVGTSGSVAQRGQQLRAFCQAGVPLIVVHPACDMLLGFELQMIQRDSGAVILPFFPEMADEVWEQAGRHFQADGTGELGTPRQLVVDRHLVAGTTTQEVQRQFARDAYGLRRLVGPVARLSALAAAPYPAELWANSSIHMTTGSGVVVRWSADSAAGEASGQLTLVGSHGRLSLPLPLPLPLPLETRPAGDEPQHLSGALSPAGQASAGAAATLVDQLEAAAAADPAARSACDRMWEDACRALELLETAEASHRRGKTLELYEEEHTEEETFKSVMAAGGCLALLVTLALFPLAGILHALDLGIFDHPRWDRGILRWLAPRNWHLVLVTLLLAFLGLQGLQLLFSRKLRPRRGSRTDRPAEDAGAAALPTVRPNGPTRDGPG